MALECILKLKFKTTGSSSCKFVDDFLDTWSEVTVYLEVVELLVDSLPLLHELLLQFSPFSRTLVPLLLL